MNYPFDFKLVAKSQLYSKIGAKTQEPQSKKKGFYDLLEKLAFLNFKKKFM